METLAESVLSTTACRRLSDAHRRRIEGPVKSARQRQDHGETHPVQDFLFQYYPFPLSLLEHWHPGVGVRLETDEETAAGGRFNPKHYTFSEDELRADPSLLPDKEAARMRWIRELLAATA